MGFPIATCVSDDPTILAVMTGPGIPSALTMEGLNAGGPINISITYTDNVFQVIPVTVVGQ
jgi:hypothetical protein